MPVMSNVSSEKAWDILDGFGNKDVVIGFADDGCRLGCVDKELSDKFAAAAFLENGKLITGTAERLSDRMFISPFRHGTALAGLMAAPLSSAHPIGVAPGCSLLPVRWEFNNGFKITQDGFRKILLFLSDKVDVFVNTWARLPSMIFNEENLALINELSCKGGRRGKGIVFVWAAGNSACPVHHSGDYDIIWNGYLDQQGCVAGIRKTKQFTHSLIDTDNVLLVSAVNGFGKRAHYSCYGTGIAVCAPSSNSHCFGANLYVEQGLTARSADEAGFTRNFKGTSGAAALVGGVAGLIISACPNLSASEIVSVIKSSASRCLDFSSYPTTEFRCAGSSSEVVSDGIKGHYSSGHFIQGGWSPWFGYGLVNAADAVRLALSI